MVSKAFCAKGRGCVSGDRASGREMMRRANSLVPPPPGMSPTPTSTSPMYVSAAATTRSACRANSAPPPSVCPWGAVTTGLEQKRKPITRFWKATTVSCSCSNFACRTQCLQGNALWVRAHRLVGPRGRIINQRPAILIAIERGVALLEHRLHPGWERESELLHQPGSLLDAQHIPGAEGSGFLSETPLQRVVNVHQRVGYLRRTPGRVHQRRQERVSYVASIAVLVGLGDRSEEHTSELQSRSDLVCRLLLEKKKKKRHHNSTTKTTKKNQIK